MNALLPHMTMAVFGTKMELSKIKYILAIEWKGNGNTGTLFISDNIACKFDYVAIYDGFNESDAKLVGKFCGKKAPQPMSSLANMIVRFKTDATVGDVGFLANYRASGES
jgi:hypothetical protein